MSRTSLCSLGLLWRGLLCMGLLGLAHCRSTSSGPTANGAPPPTTETAGPTPAPGENTPGENTPGENTPGENTPGDSAGLTPTVPLDAGSDGGNEVFRVDWCARLGVNESEAFEAANQIGIDYVTAVLADCHTAGLIDYLREEDQRFEWLYYLAEFTYYLAGCRPTFDVVEGGIDVFGPANLSSVGAMRPPLAASDADLLIDHYVQALSDALALSEAERARVRAYLATLAAAEIGLGATATLATCPAADAGSG